jgi:hypothetical protein
MGPGSSAQTAIPVRTLWQEYLWLQEHRPGGTVLRRRDMYDGERLLDILTVEGVGSDVNEIYFDVSACFSDRRPTPPCPYCGERLRTPKARQCAECFADFHDPTNVVFRKGLSYVDGVKEEAAQRRERDARPPGLNDPRAAFDALFRPRRVTADVFVLRFPEQLGAVDEKDRLFRIGVECLMADGCRGLVCHVDEPLRTFDPSATTEDGAQVGSIVRRTTWLARHAVRVVFVGGEQLVEHMRMWPFPNNCETEELAITQLTERGRGRFSHSQTALSSD